MLDKHSGQGDVVDVGFGEEAFGLGDEAVHVDAFGLDFREDRSLGFYLVGSHGVFGRSEGPTRSNGAVQNGSVTHEILYRPMAAVASIRLEPGEGVRAESGAMLAMSPNIEIEARTGGLGKIVGRLLAGESMFQSRFVASSGQGELILAPAYPGDIQAIRLEGDAYLVSSGAFLAASDGMEVNSRTRLKNFLIGESMFMLRVSGSGLLLVSAFGAIHGMELAIGQSVVVDSGHLVAWSDTMDVRVSRAARSFLGSALSGEGIVATLTGPGVIYMQTRAPQAFGAYIEQHLLRQK